MLFITVFLGLLRIASAIWHIGTELFVYFVVPLLGWQKDLRAFGEWAVVTGANCGIGEAYARELGKRGLNICLVGRKEQRLHEVATEIQKRSGVKTAVAVVDFSTPRQAAEIEAAITKALKPFLQRQSGSGQQLAKQCGKENVKENIQEGMFDMVGTLINCIGMGVVEEYHDGWTGMKPSPQTFCDEVIDVNIKSYIATTALFLPVFKTRSQGGAVVNIASMCSYIAFPCTSYGATKAYLAFLGKGLRAELAGFPNVFVQTICPGLVETKLTHLAYAQNRFCANLVGLQPRTFAKSAVDTIGWLSETAGHPWHAAQTDFFLALRALLPERAFLAFTAFMFRFTIQPTGTTPAIPAAKKIT